MLVPVLAAAAIGLGASVALVAAAMYWARRRLLLDRPNDRSLHVQPTPRGGGIGIVLPVSFAMVGVALVVPATKSPATWLVSASLLTAAVGLIDDVRPLPAIPRLVTHVFAAVLVVAGVGPWSTVAWPGIGVVDLGWAAIPLTVLLLAGLTNAYNFMDGVDGIAGAQAVVAGLGWVAVGYATQDPLLIVVGTVLATASVGFLLFNWAPASVFMGDVGSSFLGFILAALAVYAGSRSPASATAGMLFVWPFVFDATFTFLRRASRRENVLDAHRSHLYQRLVLTGVSHRTTALLYGALAVIGGAVGIAVARDARIVSFVGTLMIGVLAVTLWLVVVWRERSLARAKSSTPQR